MSETDTPHGDRHSRRFSPGDQVVLAGAPFAGLVGAVYSQEDGRLLIEVQQGCYVRCPQEQVQRLETRSSPGS